MNLYLKKIHSFLDLLETNCIRLSYDVIMNCSMCILQDWAACHNNHFANRVVASELMHVLCQNDPGYNTEITLFMTFSVQQIIQLMKLVM